MLPLVTNSPTKPAAASLFLGQRLRPASAYGRLIGVLLARRAVIAHTPFAKVAPVDQHEVEPAPRYDRGQATA
jgi:hypothetical protein